MAQVIQVGSNVVTYEEVPGAGADRLFNVTVAGVEYQLAANSLGQIAATGDHPIVAKHPDVVKMILGREYSPLVVEYSDGSRRRLPPGHGVVRGAATKGLAPHLLLGEKMSEQAIAVLPIESSDTTAAAPGEEIWVHDRGGKAYWRARVAK